MRKPGHVTGGRAGRAAAGPRAAPRGKAPPRHGAGEGEIRELTISPRRIPFTPNFSGFLTNSTSPLIQPTKLVNRGAARGARPHLCHGDCSGPAKGRGPAREGTERVPRATPATARPDPRRPGAAPPSPQLRDRSPPEPRSRSRSPSGGVLPGPGAHSPDGGTKCRNLPGSGGAQATARWAGLRCRRRRLRRAAPGRFQATETPQAPPRPAPAPPRPGPASPRPGPASVRLRASATRPRPRDRVGPRPQ